MTLVLEECGLRIGELCTLRLDCLSRDPAGDYFMGYHQPKSAACAIQRALQVEAWPTPEPLSVRMALHTGEADVRDGDYYGSAVNRCALLRAIAHGGLVLLPDAVGGLMSHGLPNGVGLRDLGQHRLKDLHHLERVFQLLIGDLPSDFPPLRTLEGRPRNLPLQTTPLLGRERAVAAVPEQLLQGDLWLLTLTGPGGTGKTRLGLQVGAELINSLQDGVLFVDLAPIADHALVAPTIAQTLAIRDVGARPTLDSLSEYLRHKDTLLVLDNFEQVLGAASLVNDLLQAGPGFKVLVTSREPLQVHGEHEFPVPLLALPDPKRPLPVETLSQYWAVAVFIERATAIRPDLSFTSANATAVAAICVRLDGLPLAIELAAARIRLLSAQAMVARLEHPLPLLASGAPPAGSVADPARGHRVELRPPGWPRAKPVPPTVGLRGRLLPRGRPSGRQRRGSGRRLTRRTGIAGGQEFIAPRGGPGG
jgi:NB-ARC domain